MQSRATQQVSNAQQGQFQGVLSAVISLATVVGPLAFWAINLLVQPQWPGAIWRSMVVVNLLIVPIVITGFKPG